MARITHIISVLLILSIVDQIRSHLTSQRSEISCLDSEIDFSQRDSIIVKNVKSSEEFGCVCERIRYNGKKKWDFRNIDFGNASIPRGAFIGSRVETLIFRDFFLNNLSDENQMLTPPFSGLEKTLKELIILNPLKGVMWEWGELSNLSNIERFVISHGSFRDELETTRLVAEKFKKLNGTSVKWFQITGGCMSQLEEDLLPSFTSLKYLHLQSNEMSEFNRQALPDYLQHLEYIDLSDNLIVSLKPRTFNNMPILKEVSLENNRIQRLMAHSFKPLITTRKFYLYDNKIRCDSGIKWLVEDNTIIDLFEKDMRPLLCSLPDATMGGRAIRGLNLEELSSMPKKTLSPVLMLPANYLPLHICEPSSWLNLSVKS